MTLLSKTDKISPNTWLSIDITGAKIYVTNCAEFVTMAAIEEKGSSTMLMEISAERALMGYAEAYHKLYNRQPRDLRAVDNEWVIVNGARMRAIELEYLTRQLQQEYSQGLEQKKSMVLRLLKWFKQ